MPPAPSASPAAVRFEGVTKRYGGQTVLERVSLDLSLSRTTAVVGESGSGKSTLLQLINGLVRPDEGSVSVLGEPVVEETLLSLRRRIGYAVQGSALFPHLTVHDNVTLLARLLEWPAGRRQARFDRLMELMELELALAGRYPHELSGGQQQRVSLCRAMMLEPPLLLLDEPFSAVDPITRVGIHDHFKRLAESEPVTVVLVTHDLREAVELASELVILRAGAVAQRGPVPAVLAAPADDWIARLFTSQLR